MTQPKAVESVFRGTNSELMEYIASLYISGDVLDVTYGQGGWWDWTAVADITLTSNDLFNEAAVYVDHQHDYRRLPWEWEESFDAVAFDPPYIAKGGRETSRIEDFDTAYGLKRCPPTVEGLARQNLVGAIECGRVLRRGGYLLYKCSDYISSATYQRGGCWSVDHLEMAGCVLEDVFIHHSGTGPQPKKNRDGTDRRQVHSRRAHSYLLIGRKR